MRRLNKVSMTTVLIASFVVAVLGLTGPTAVFAAATAPPLGAAASFSVLGAAAMSAANPTTVSHDLGLSPGLEPSKTGTWYVGGTEYFGPTSLAGTAQIDALNAFNVLAGEGSNGGWGTSSWSPAPGVYTIASDTTYTGTITLNGSYDDVWVFQVGRDMTFSGSVVLASNAQACHVFWQVGRSTVIASGSTFVGTLIAHDDISFASGANVNGRVISLTGTTLTMDGVGGNISGPTCVAAPLPPSGRGTINVVKNVINDGTGTRAIVDFPLFINGVSAISGTTYSFFAPADVFTITEANDSGYIRTFSGDCDVNGQLTLVPGDQKICIVTNNDIAGPVVPPVPPLIDVVKTASPLSLSAGPGSVTYTYTLRNIGTVPVTNIMMVGDTCSPIVLASGDTNVDAKLDLTEIWTYHCSTTLSATHTNTVIATGWANGINAIDIASATVVVGLPIVPPLIHVTKVPSPLTLPTGGGWVTYTKKVTNPGAVALSNVRLTDDKCALVKYISGDTNGDSKLDTTETWTYTCRTNLTKTTVNTVTASGEANGLTARDFAIATVVVASPKLPNTGLPPAGAGISWSIVIISVSLILVSSSLILILKKRTI